MKAGWSLREIGEAFQTVTGNTPPKSAAHFYGQDIPLVKPPELTDGDVSSASDGLTESGAAVARVAPEGSVLVSCIGNLGKIGLATRPLAFNQQINAIYPDPSLALPRFTFYQALSPKFREQLDALAAGTTVSIVNKSRFNSIKVHLPPLEEQQRIVAVLDEAFEGLARARAHTKANLSDAEKIAAHALDVLLDELRLKNGQVQIIYFAEVKGGKRLPKGVKPSPKPTPFPYISVKDLTDDGSVCTEKVGYISAEVQQTIQRYTISSRDVYVSIAGTIGKTGIVPPELDGANLTENAAKLVLREGWSPQYVYWCTRSSTFAVQTAEQTRTAAQPKLALQRLGAIHIPNANASEQVEISEKMDALRHTRQSLISAYSAKLQDLDDLRQSVLQKAFAGELTKGI